MNTAMIEAKPAREAILFSVTEETVKPMVEKYLAMKIAGVDDKTGIAAVRAARQEVRKARTTVDKERESAKRYYLEEGRKIDAAAKQLFAALEPAEEYLVSELDRIDAENQRIADEKLDRQLEKRQSLLTEIGGVPSTVSQQFTPEVIRGMTAERFTAFCEEMTELNARLAAEAKERAEAEERNRIEKERLAAEREELDRLRKAESERQQAEQKRLAEERRIEEQKLASEREEQRRVAAAEQARLDAQRAEQKRLADEEQARLDAQRAEQKRESDRIEAERKKLADEAEAKRQAELRAIEEKRKAEEVEALRIANEKSRAAMLPHRDKVLAYRDALLAVEIPKLPAKLADATAAMNGLQAIIADQLNKVAEKLGGGRRE